MKLEQIGWDGHFVSAFEPLAAGGHEPARVVTTNRGVYTVRTERGDLVAELTGRFRKDTGPDEIPVVGDWVTMERESEERGTIHALLPRRTAISRKRTGRTAQAQVLAANVDFAFLVNGLDGGRGLNARRLERFLMLAWESGADPVIVLNKVDLCDDPEEALAGTEALAGGAPVVAVSATEGTGVEHLHTYLVQGRTGVLLGMSGVGKSALINTLTGGSAQRVGTVRGNDLRGRHTTTQSRLVALPGGGMLIDTAGLRELQPWIGEEGVGSAFPEIETLSVHCRFRDCRHEGEPGCAVQAALEAGELEAARYESYVQLRREQAFLETRVDERAARAGKARDKRFGRMLKDMKKKKTKW